MRLGNWCPPSGERFRKTVTSTGQCVSSPSTLPTKASVRPLERRSVLRMPCRKGLNCPALLTLAFDAGWALEGRGALRGRYGGRGKGNVVRKTGQGSSRLRFSDTGICEMFCKASCTHGAIVSRGGNSACLMRRTAVMSWYSTLPLVVVSTPDFHCLSWSRHRRSVWIDKVSVATS